MTKVKIEKGKFVFGSDITEQRFFEKYEGKDMVIEQIKRRRSLQQNSYYWVYLTVISTETGNDVNDLHELMKQRFLPSVIVKIKGKKATHSFERKKSTTELTKAEFNEYLERIRAFTEVPLPDPEAAGYISNY